MAWNEPGGNGNNQDPWNSGGKRNGGGNNDQGPPDLDEALQKLQERLNGIFGKPKKSGGSGGSNVAGPSKGFLGLLVLILLGGWVAMGFYTVDQQQRAVVLTLGKYSETKMPGLRWNPPLIDSVDQVNVTQINAYDHRSLMLTEDENIVDVTITVQYVISDPKAYLLEVRDPKASLANAAESALRHIVGGSEMDSVLTEGREILGTDVKTRLQRYMDEYQTGLRITQVNIKDLNPPSQVQDAFDDVIRAREDEQRVINEAESYRNGIVPEARGIAQRMKEEASAYREQIVAQAEGDAERFEALLTEYLKAPEVTRERLYLDTMETVMANNSKVLVDVEGGNNMMYLPLDKLAERRQAPLDISRSGGRLSSDNIRDITDQVIEQLRQRQQTTRREAR